jgi:hypothetical protein
MPFLCLSVRACRFAVAVEVTLAYGEVTTLGQAGQVTKAGAISCAAVQWMMPVVVMAPMGQAR